VRVAAARFCHRGEPRPVPVDAACCRPWCGSLLFVVGVVAGCRLLLLVGGVVACCIPQLLADRQPKVSDRQMILKVCITVCARVLVREVKVNQIVCDFLGYHRERIGAP